MSSSDKERKYFPIIVISISALVWLISNINCPLRFTLAPLEFTRWHIFAIVINFLLFGFLLTKAKWRKYCFYPLFYNVHPILYIAMSFLIKALVGVDYESNITVKFTSDILYFIFEILFFVPFVVFFKGGNPLNIRFLKPGFKNDLKERPKWFRNLFTIGTVVFLVGVFVLAFIYPSRIGVPAEIVKKLLIFQIIFAITLGFKEEFIWRWLFQNRMYKDTGNIILAVFFQSIIWMGYHVFFGEGTGTGFWSGVMTLAAAVYWGYCSYAFKNIWISFIAHIGIELFGFYLMYDSFIKTFLM